MSGLPINPRKAKNSVEPSDEYEHGAQPMYTAQIAEFLGAIRDGRQPQPDGAHGRTVVEVAERAYSSAAGPSS